MRKSLLVILLLAMLGLGGGLYLRSHRTVTIEPTPAAKLDSSPPPSVALIADTPPAPPESVQESREHPSAFATQAVAQGVTVPAQKPGSPYARIYIPAGQPVPELFPFQTERDAIFAIVGSDTQAKIPAIAAYLSHKDATVREAARQGLIQVGDEKAIPVLKEAAAKAPTDEERQDLLESAEFLALPNFVDIVLPSLANSNPKS